MFLPSLAAENAVDGILFDRLALADAAHVPLGARKARREKGAHDFLRERGPDHPGPQAEDVHRVVLDALPRGKGVMAQAGANPGDLVRRDRRPHPAPADEDAPLAGARRNGLGDLPREVGIVGGRIVERADVLDRMAPGPAERGELDLQREARMVAADCDLHRRLRARRTTLSTLNPSSFKTVSPGAEAPNRSRLTESPASPTYLFHPSATPASIARRAGTDGGSTSSRYSRGWRS